MFAFSCIWERIDFCSYFVCCGTPIHRNFFESCLSLVRDSDALIDIETLLHLPNKIMKDYAVNSLQKRKIGKEMHMNIHIGDYEVDSVILDLGSDVNILTKRTW